MIKQIDEICLEKHLLWWLEETSVNIILHVYIKYNHSFIFFQITHCHSFPGWNNISSYSNPTVLMRSWNRNNHEELASSGCFLSIIIGTKWMSGALNKSMFSKEQWTILHCAENSCNSYKRYVLWIKVSHLQVILTLGIGWSISMEFYNPQ